jgi:peptidoglycan hydrolase-like protein with peptidoglycan-binding domain
MFAYKDPTGTDFLQRQGALTSYQGKMQALYDEYAKTGGTKFVRVERFDRLKPGVQPTLKPVPWIAFPKLRGNSSPAEIDRNRGFHEEYTEWVAQSSNGKLDRVTFTTEFSEYFQTLADLGFDALVAGIKEVIPTANPTVRELLGVDQKPTTLTPDGVVGPTTWDVLNNVLARLDSNVEVMRLGSRGGAVEGLQTRLIWLGLLDAKADGDFGPKTDAAVKAFQRKYTRAGILFRNNLSNNPWNNGQKGVLCMANRDNAARLLFGLAANCSTPRNVPVQDVCSIVGAKNCVPGRNSDPFVCSEAQTAVKNGNVITLNDPVGVEIITLQGRWQINGVEININDPQSNQGVWTVSRGKHRAVFKNVPGLTVDGVAITTGAQVARKLQVGAKVLVTAATNLL